jgi:polyhydroxybutyrate depolymerase
VRRAALGVAATVVLAAAVTVVFLRGPAIAGRPTPAAYGASAGTACAGQPRAGSATLTAVYAGRRRLVRVHVPRGYTGHRPLPLIVNLHGSSSTAAKQESLTGLDALADQRDFIVAYPQGGRASGSGYAWNVPGTGGKGPDDVAFLALAVTLLREHYCVDGHRVYAAGFSGGARMLSAYACAGRTTFAAYATVSGMRAPLPCHTGRSVSIIALHGTADGANPYNGHGAAYWTYSVPMAAARWAGYEKCATTPTVTHTAPGVTLTAYQGCRSGGAVQLYTLDGRKHVWPRLQAGTTGPGTIDANDVLWRFFQAHPAP